MKQKLIALLLLGQVFTAVYSQTLTVRPISGAVTAFNVADIKKLSFVDGKLVVTSKNTTSNFALAENRSLFFSTINLSTTANALVKSSFYLYLNPVSAVLTITNLDTSALITDYSIIALDGRVLKTQQHIHQNEAKVQLTDLPTGVYFCRINTNTNIQTLKFLKQ